MSFGDNITFRGNHLKVIIILNFDFEYEITNFSPKNLPFMYLEQ